MWKKYFLLLLLKEIIIVDDKSTDGTSEILDQEISPLVSKVIHHEVNQGKEELYVLAFNMRPAMWLSFRMLIWNMIRMIIR